jgi:hypothetical protein
MMALATANASLTSAQSYFTALKIAVKSLQGNTNNRNHNHNVPATERKYHNDNYCWMHGYDIHNQHTISRSCRFPKDNHKHDATRQNTMGGSDKSKSLFL